MDIDTNLFQAGYTGGENPNFYFIFRKEGMGLAKDRMVIKIPVLEPRGRKLVIEYQRTEPTVDALAVEALVVDALLGRFVGLDFYRSQVDLIELRDLSTGRSVTIPYPA